MRVTVVRLLDIPLVDKRFESGFPNFSTQSDADAYLATWLPCAKTVVDVFRKDFNNNPSQLVVGEFGGRLCITAKNHHGNLQRSEWPCACEPSRGMLCGFHQTEQDKADLAALVASLEHAPKCDHRRGFRSALDKRCIDCGMTAENMAKQRIDVAKSTAVGGHLASEFLQPAQTYGEVTLKYGSEDELRMAGQYAWLPYVKPKSRECACDGQFHDGNKERNKSIHSPEKCEGFAGGDWQKCIAADNKSTLSISPNDYVHPRSLRGRVNVGALELEDLEDLVAG